MEWNAANSPIQQDGSLLNKFPTNPLENSLVAEVLETRDVNQDSSSYNLNGILTLYQSDNPCHDQDNTVKEESLQLNEFRQRYSNPKDNLFKFPSQKYELRFWNLQPYHFSSEKCIFSSDLSSWFWVTCSPVIKHLTLHHCNSLGTFTVFSEEFLKALPNLTSLKILGGTLTPEAFKIVKEQFDSKIDYYEHLNLKSLHFEPLIPQEKLRILWCVFQKSLPNLEHLKIRRLCEGKKPDQFTISDFTRKAMEYNCQTGLKNLDLIEFTTANLDHRSLRNLPVLCGEGISSFPDTFQVFSTSFQNGDLTNNGGNLDIYLCPFVKPITRVPWGSRLYHLHELHLWGSICCSLDFLDSCRNLAVLVWKTSCWEKTEHRRRVLQYLREGTDQKWKNRNYLGGGIDVEVIGNKVEKWKEPFEGDYGAAQKFLEDHFRSLGVPTVEVTFRGGESASGRKTSPMCLRRLEVDWRLKGKYGWKGLGKLITGVRELKGVVRGDEQLRDIMEIWGKELEIFEMGHGSGGVTKEGLIEVVMEGMGCLKEFRWKGCNCLEGMLGEGEDWLEVELRLKEKLGEENVTVPWRKKDEEGENLEGICLEAEFDKAVRTGRIDGRILENMMEL